MKVTIGTVVNKETSVVRDLEVSIECRKKRVIEHREDLSFHLNVRELLCAKRVFINNLKSKISAIIVSETAKKNSAEISSAYVTEKLQVTKMELSVGRDICGGFNGGPVRVQSSVWTRMKRNRSGCSNCGSGSSRETVVEAES